MLLGEELCLKVFLFFSVLDGKGENTTKIQINMLLSEVLLKERRHAF